MRPKRGIKILWGMKWCADIGEGVNNCLKTKIEDWERDGIAKDDIMISLL